MTSNGEERMREGLPSNLAEFETESATSLAPFESSCSVLLDEFERVGSSGALEEFEASLEMILADGLGADPNDTEPEHPDEEEHVEQPEEGEGPPEEPAGETEEEKPEDEAKEEVGEAEELIEVEPPIEEEEEVFHEPEVPIAPAGPVVGFVCEHAVDAAEFVTDDGRLVDRPIVRIITLPCAGMVKPQWLRRVLEGGGSGAFVVSCSRDCCLHRRGASILTDRWKGRRRPILLSRCDRRRLKLFEGHFSGRQDLLKSIDKFVLALGALDALERAGADQEGVGEAGKDEQDMSWPIGHADI